MTKNERQEFVDRIEALKQAAIDDPNNPNDLWVATPNDIQAASAFRYTAFRGVRLGHNDLADLDLHDFVFKGSRVQYVNFNRCNLNYAIFEDAAAYDASFISASLRQADFERADLEKADFTNADLAGAYFAGARLYATVGIMTVGPIGQFGRVIYAYTRNGEIRIQAGCFNGTPEQLLAAIDEKYLVRSLRKYRQDYRDAVRYLEAWGKREVKRVTALGLLEPKPSA